MKSHRHPSGQSTRKKILPIGKSMGSRPEYIEANREEINLKRRKRYNSESRKADYQLKRCEILQKGREDRANCPLCGLDFRRLYIRKHLITRHKLAELPDLTNLCKTVEDKIL
jgi:hypothetical protein